MNQTRTLSPPKVSVITGYYNRGYALDKTIDSIMKQSFIDFEFIVFNDKSKDDTEQRLIEINQRYNDPRLVIINHEANKGFVQGMIDAIKLSKGQYICVQGSGDISHTDRLMHQVTVLEKHPCIGLVNCFYQNFVEDQNIFRVREKVADHIKFKELVKENIFSHGEVMFRRDTYISVGGYRPEFVNCQDYDLWLRMIKVTNFFTVKKVLYTRYVRSDGVSYRPDQFLRQLKFAFMCRELAQFNMSEQQQKLINMRSKGIDEYVSLNSFLGQKEIIKAVLRAVVWGKYDLSIELNNKGIVNTFIRYFLTIFVKFYKSPAGKPIKRMVNRKYNIN